MFLGTAAAGVMLGGATSLVRRALATVHWDRQIDWRHKGVHRHREDGEHCEVPKHSEHCHQTINVLVFLASGT